MECERLVFNYEQSREDYRRNSRTRVWQDKSCPSHFGTDKVAIVQSSNSTRYLILRTQQTLSLSGMKNYPSFVQENILDFFNHKKAIPTNNKESMILQLEKFLSEVGQVYKYAIYKGYNEDFERIYP